jgi:ornithine carbamoyltransferase
MGDSMKEKFKGKHFLTCDDWTKEELDDVFDTSFDLKEKFKNEEPTRVLRDKTLFMIFLGMLTILLQIKCSFHTENQQKIQQ